MGFDGPTGWVPNETAFDNQYYEELVGAGTSLNRQINGAPQWRRAMVNNTDNEHPNRHQWEGFPGGRKVLMLNSDIALVRQLDSSNKDPQTGRVSCKFVERENHPDPPCPVARSDIFQPMVTYRNDNNRFLRDFREALIKLTNNGHVVRACDERGFCQLRPRGSGGQ